MANKRVIDLATLSETVQEGQYILADSAGGTGKMNLKQILDDNTLDPEGEYPDLYAGNLTTDKAQTDRTPYLFRKTGGTLSGVGERCYDTLVGASVGENQLIQNGDFSDGTTGWSKGNTSSWEVTADGIDVTVTQADNLLLKEFSYLPHKYVCLVALKTTTATTNVGIRFGRSPYQWKGCEATTSRQVVAGVFSVTEAYSDYVRFPDLRSSGWDKVHFYSISIIDLTQMLGSSIADYIYSLESATAGSGIAKLREWGFLRGYQAYNAGSLESVEVTGKKVVGFNQFDSTSATVGKFIQVDGSVSNDSNCFVSDYIRVIPNTTYYCNHVIGTGVHTNVYCTFDADKNMIGNGSAGAGTDKEISINIESSVYYIRFNGLNASIDSTAFSLSSDRNGEYEAYSAQEYDYGDDTLRGIFKLDASNNLYADGDRKTSDGVITRHYGTRAYQSGDESLPDAITDGTTTVYKLTTPTTEQGDPFPSPQVCYPDGTEEYVTGNGVPVGHETEYPYDLKGLVEGLIDVPDVPSANGTYVLKATRSASGVSFAWVTG